MARTHIAAPIALQMLLTCFASGQSPSAANQDQDVEDRLQQMQQELEAVRDDNAELRHELDELRAQTSEDWLTEQRAAEIRGLVHDVLADADVRSSLLNDGLTAGWDEHFFLASPDGRFRLELDGQIQTRWMYNFHDQPDRHRHGFEVPRAKLTFRGHVFNPDITYLVRTDVTRNEPNLVTGLIFLQDAWVRVNLNNETSIRVGQFKIPFMREELVSSSRQLAVERSLINENLSVDRSQGVELTWARGQSKVDFMIADAGLDQVGGFGLVGTSPITITTNALDADSDITLALRYEHLVAGTWRQFEDFTSPPGDQQGTLLGIAAFYQAPETGIRSGQRDEVYWFASTADLSMEWGGANAFTSFTYHYIDSPFRNFNIFGVVVQGGIYVTPKVETFARFEYGWWDFQGNSLSDLTLLTLGVNYYIDGHDLKWTTDIGFGISKIESSWDASIANYREEVDDAEPQIVFRTQFQLLF
jgi:hypothetical protein